MLLTRYEFIGLQNGETVYGHSYRKNKEDFIQWLGSQGITKCVTGYAGFVPEDLVLTYQFVAAMFEVTGKKNTALLHYMNQLALDGVITVDNMEAVVEGFIDER